MSIKTLRKRIALVAVSALGAGLMSVVAVPSANAAVNGTDTFDIARTASTTGSASVADDIANARSVGYVAPTNAIGDIATGSVSVAVGQAHTAVVLQNAQIAFNVNGTTTGATTGISVVVSGGTLSGVTIKDAGDAAANTGVLSLNGATTIAVLKNSVATKGELRGIFSVSSSAAVGSTVSMAAYVGTDITSTTPTNGTLIGTYTFTIASASVSGVYSSALSTINTQTPIAKSGTPAGTNGYDSTGRIDNGKVGLVYFSLKDGYNADLTSGTLTASVTAGSTVIDLSAGAGDAYAASTAYDDQAITSDANGYIIVTQPVANTAGTSTLTVTYQGAVIATKTFNWNGDIASITVDTANSNSVFYNGASDSGQGNDRYASGIVYVVKDAAGNPVNITSAPTLTGATGALVGASLTTATATTFGTLMNTTDGYGLTTMVVPSSTLNGAATYKLRVQNSAGVNIDSPVVTATVALGIDSFAISWDKTSYAPGEIATMTVTAKDSKGNPVADGSLATGISFTAPSGFTVTGTACDAAKAFSGGSFTCKLAAGNTAGSYAYSFDISTGTAQSPAIGSVNITSSGVSNAEVLAAIVKLIASINKQIRALQKQLKR